MTLSAAKAPKADGLVTKTPGLALSSLAADCGPVLFCDPDARIIGACHAGWRGALAGITDETLKAMIAIGAARDNIHAVLGPCISQDSYEVGHDYRDGFVAENEAHDRFFKLGSPQNPKSDKPHFDLKRFIIAKLRGAGLTQIEALPDCTYAQPEDYFKLSLQHPSRHFGLWPQYFCNNAYQIADKGDLQAPRPALLRPQSKPIKTKTRR